jgi:hypothetical protein
MTDRVPQDLKNIEAASGVTKQPNSTPSIKWTLAVSTRHAASRACVQTATCMISNVVPGRYNVKVHQQRGDPRFVPTVVDVKTAIFQAESASSSLAQSLPLSVQEVLFDASSGMYLYSLKHALGHAEGISLRCPETYTLELSSGKDVLFGVQSTATTSNQSADQKEIHSTAISVCEATLPRLFTKLVEHARPLLVRGTSSKWSTHQDLIKAGPLLFCSTNTPI